MSFLTWIVLGLIAGFIASKIVDKRARDCSSISFWEELVRSSEDGCFSSSAGAGLPA